VELENERVRVVRITFGPHEKSVMHGHPSTITVNLTDACFKFTYHGGKTDIIEAKAGQVLSFPAFEYLPENLSDKSFEAIAIELK
jgi:quercetin dioxygenase-like cupin family protein